MDSRMVFAIVLSAIVLIGYQVFFFDDMDSVEKAIGDAPTEVEERAPSPESEQHQVAQETLPQMEFGSLPAGPPDATAPTQPLTVMEGGEDIVLQNEHIIATFSTHGAHLKSLLLKHHREDGRDGGMVEMLRPGYPAFSTVIITSSGSTDLAAQPFEVENLQAKSATFRTQLASGEELRKHFQLSHDYQFTIRYEMDCPNSNCASLTTLPTEIVENVAGDMFTFDGIIHGNQDDGLEKIKYDDIKSVRDIPNTQYAGVMDKYFLMAFLTTPQDTFRLFPDIPQRGASLVSPIHQEITVFTGPKIKDYLDCYDVGLHRTIDYGFLGFLAAPLMTAIRWFHAMTGNYGVAIILLTVVIKIIFFPLSQKSYKSMKQMSKLAPEMKKIKEKYKNDKEKLNVATMDLYKKHKVNPLSGCLPIIVQIPVFIALYKTLLNAIELRDAPFIFWITDLSVADPYYITPIIMGATMFLQQKMAPSTMDPMQRKIMLTLPIVFTFLFMTFPAGLIIYWIANNVLSIAQQYLVLKQKD